MKNALRSTRAAPSRLGVLLTGVLVAGALSWQVSPARAAEAAVVIPPALTDLPGAGRATSETAVFAGGCFWGVQGVFQHVKGVSRAVSGYAGGDARSARYESVGSGDTGHAEAVRITYDPREISYGQLLQIYFSVAHDPTTLNRQGPDRGTQYRSTVFAQNPEQARVAKAYIAQLEQSKRFAGHLVTTVESDKPFFAAEAYHQDYLTLHPNQPYIVVNDKPKVDNLKQLFRDRYRETPVLVGANG